MSETIRAYRPSNGCEGMDFMDRWCVRCWRDAAYDDGCSGAGCEIAARALAFHEDDPDYPKEWVEDDALGPRCTAFEPIETGGTVHDARQEEMPL